MSMPAGWYDDGSGRQRWWDGSRWTDDYAQNQNATAAPVTSTSATPGRPSAPVLGFVGLGLAVLGTILACIPVVFGVGVVLLVGAFVVSLIGLLKKNAAKWPSIVGMILSVVGGVLGTIVLVVSLLATTPGPIATSPSSEVPPSTSTEPSDPPPGTSDRRPSPEEIAEEFAATARAGGITTYDDMPEFYPCLGQYLYDSELSDEALRLVIAGDDPPESERATAEKVISNAVLTCDPQASDPDPEP